MHRRSFLKSTVVGATAVGAGSCAHLGTVLTTTGSDVLAMVNQLRANLDYLASPEAKVDATASLPANMLAGTPSAAEEQLFRDGVQTLVLVGTFHSMSEDVRAHPAVQELMGEKLAMISSTAQQMNRVATGTTPEERRALTTLLKEDPSALNDAAQHLDTEASRLGLSGELRVRLRGLFAQVGSRMKQSASLTIEEYSHKVARIEERMAGPRAFEREYIAQLGEQAFWDFQARQEGYASAWAAQAIASPVRPAAPVGARGAPVAPGSAKVPRRVNDGSVAIPVGGSLLGVGLLTGGVAALAIIVGHAGVMGLFVVTPAALLFIAGLITLLVGLARRADTHRQPRQAP